jgi:hypothetical protein
MALPGQPVVIPRGRYSGPVVICQPMQILASGVVLVSDFEPALVIDAEDVSIRGLRVRTALGSQVAVEVRQSRGLTLRDVVVDGDIVGLDSEAGSWLLPASVNLVTLPGEPSSHRVRVRVPVQVWCSSTIDALTITPTELEPGVHDLRLDLERLPSGSIIMGTLLIQTSNFHRLITVTGQVGESLLPDQPARVNEELPGAGAVLTGAPLGEAPIDAVVLGMGAPARETESAHGEPRLDEEPESPEPANPLAGTVLLPNGQPPTTITELEGLIQSGIVDVLAAVRFGNMSAWLGQMADMDEEAKRLTKLVKDNTMRDEQLLMGLGMLLNPARDVDFGPFSCNPNQFLQNWDALLQRATEVKDETALQWVSDFLDRGILGVVAVVDGDGRLSRVASDWRASLVELRRLWPQPRLATSDYSLENAQIARILIDANYRNRLVDWVGMKEQPRVLPEEIILALTPTTVPRGRRLPSESGRIPAPIAEWRDLRSATVNRRNYSRSALPEQAPLVDVQPEPADSELSSDQQRSPRNVATVVTWLVMLGAAFVLVLRWLNPG